MFYARLMLNNYLLKIIHNNKIYKTLARQHQQLYSNIKVFVNDKPIKVPSGYTVLETCAETGYKITKPCLLQDSCGKCSNVKIEGSPENKSKLACNTKVTDGMRIKVDSFVHQENELKHNDEPNSSDNKLLKYFKENKIKCLGCGARIQCDSQLEPGYKDSIYIKKINPKRADYIICNRCYCLEGNNVDEQIKFFKYDYDELVMNPILNSNRKILVVLVIDLLNMPNSIYDGWSKFIGQSNIDLFILGNKLDVLPNTGKKWIENIVECLEHNCKKKGISGEQVKYVDVISASTGYNLEYLVSELIDRWNDKGNVYLLGASNSGKSLLFNKLILSDYCTALASTALSMATVSKYPNTTLDLIRFPIHEMDKTILEIRNKRLKLQQEKEYEQNLKRLDYVKKNLSQLNLHEICQKLTVYENVYHTFKNRDIFSIAQDVRDIKEKTKIIQAVARKIFKISSMDLVNCVHDTPGIMTCAEFVLEMNKKDIELVSPHGMSLIRHMWLLPGQSIVLGGVMRIDLVKTTRSELVLFSFSCGFKYSQPFETSNYELMPQNSNKLYKHKMSCKEYTITGLGMDRAVGDIVFSCFGWTSVTSGNGTEAIIRAYTIDEAGLQLRQPSLLPNISNLCNFSKEIDSQPQCYHAKIPKHQYDIK